MRAPQTVVLFATPKILSDFDAPAADIAHFLERYAPLTSRAAETIVIFAVGNSEHVLTYQGRDFWGDSVEWARYTGLEEVSQRVLHYGQLAGIVAAFKAHAAATRMRLKVFDQVDSGNEFAREYFKLNLHPECFPLNWASFDIRGELTADTLRYASAPDGIPAGTTCGTFLVNQVRAYVEDLGFDGILYGNQLGTRGRWTPGNGPGYSAEEATAIREFFQYSKSMLGSRDLMWFDTYNNLTEEQKTWSVPPDAYEPFDYIIVAGFCVVSSPDRYLDNLITKVNLRTHARILGTVDWVDPWYEYNSMTAFPQCSSSLERLAVEHRFNLDGIVFFANDDDGSLVPGHRMVSFAESFFPTE